MVAENLESDTARQCMQEAFAQVRAYARATRDIHQEARRQNQVRLIFNEIHSLVRALARM
jgi:hypothetical protein